MMNETGGDLSVLILTETELDWETFATWYSVYKNLPDAKVSIGCKRTKSTPFQYYQWVKRLKLPLFHYNPLDPSDVQISNLDAIGKAISKGFLGKNILVLTPLTVVLSVLEQKLLTDLNEQMILVDEHVWFMKEPSISKMLDAYFISGIRLAQNYSLSVEAKEDETTHSIVSYRKGCGKWIHTLRGCPFSNAGGLVSSEMTVSENRIIDLWKRMCPLYSALA